jgi:hypothetical protein
VYVGVSLRAAELGQRAGVYRSVRTGCVASADDSLTDLIGSGLSGLPDKVFLHSTGSRIVGGDSLLPARMGRVIRTTDRV